MTHSDLRARQKPSYWRDTLHNMSRRLALACFILAPLPFGSVNFVWTCIWIAVMSASLMTADLRQLRAAHIWLLIPVFTILAVTGAVTLIQIWPNAPIGQPDEAWQSAAKLLNLDLPGRISPTKALPWLGFGYPLLLSLVFTRSILLGAEPQYAKRLFKILAWTTLVYAVYSLVAYLADPHSLLMRRKEAYLNAATGTFVNRNTAATFFGCGTLLFLLPLMRILHRQDRLYGPDSGRLRDIITFYLDSPISLAAGALICILATALTGSRAGLLLTIMAMLLGSGLYIGPLNRPGLRRWKLLALTGLGAVIILQIVGTAVAGRILTYGMFDAQRVAVYETVFSMIKEHPLLGIGLGNFETIFPSVRPASLGSEFVWDRVHSTPLELSLNLGIPLTFMIGATCLGYIYHLLKSCLQGPRDRYISIMGFCIGLLGIAHSAIDFSLQIPGFGIFFMALTGCAIAHSKISPRSRASHPPSNEPV